MCGIAGYFRPGGIALQQAKNVSHEMAAALAHRGPDDEGVWLDASCGIALAHRRLAVVDRSAAGRQPMQSQSGRYVLVINGEIYNHAEIRLRLDREGRGATRWKGNSDTESLLAAIEEFGVCTALQEAVGMFAFALWDRRERVLYLARDRIGEKPLYYGWQNGVFMFGSELKALVKHPCFTGAIDREALTLFLRHSYVPSPWSIYQGIRKLAPGTYIRVNGDRCAGEGRVQEPERYWSLEGAIVRGEERPFEGDADEAVDALQNVLADAVVAQLAADVPLGAFLSGGIDSSTIVALMQAHSSRPVKTFTIGFDDPRYDEAVAAKAVAGYLHTDHTELYVSSQDALDVIPRLPALYDEPFADSSQIPTALVAEMTRKHVTVALSGDGGDELFGGYRRYRQMRTLWGFVSSIPAPLRRLSKFAVASPPSGWWSSMWLFDKARKLAEIMDCQRPEQLYHGLVSHWKEPTTIVRQASEPGTRLSDHLAWPLQAHELESRLMAVDALTYLPDDILVKVDRAAMGASLETRAPFLDHRVVEFAWRLPLSVKIRNGRGKWVLREVLHRHVPPQLVERPKMGFRVPLAAWLRGPLRDWAESLLDEYRLRTEGFLRAGPIRRKWTDHVTGRGEWAAYLWDVLMFQAWLGGTR